MPYASCQGEGQVSLPACTAAAVTVRPCPPQLCLSHMLAPVHAGPNCLAVFGPPRVALAAPNSFAQLPATTACNARG